ncbi:FecR domain-containing protein [Pedobacter sp. MC2016-14]|uniref:FecR family protein n=1 Tax=Pedobacter sp. MC2016-14 TaxID=2897327 RepID=UPI001E46A7B3|nr:FecR family protein [Pedobacter sp. MC2016-14]MCD0488646.1 FecR domain-containing protein [Pedobacter sp. MC2016-14]
MEQQRFTYLFQAYVNKEASSKEQAELMSLLKEGKYAAPLDLLMDDLWNTVGPVPMAKAEADEILRKVLSAEPEIKEKRISLYRLWLPWAAAVIILLTAGLFFFNNFSSKPAAQFMVKNQVKESGATLVAASAKEHKKIKLPDGSTVILNNESTLEYPAQFTSTTREVTLRGEGYFDVIHDSSKSFIVHTGKIKTVVLGTAFNVKAYTKNKDVVVTVTRGKVSVQNEQQLLGIIVPNQQIVFSKDVKKSKLVPVKALSVVQWQEKDLFFDDVSMEQAMSMLSTRFGTKITFANEKTKNCRFTATFLNGESLDEILRLICSYNNAQYRTIAGGITIKGEGCES